jgi:hypothetical protein
MIMNNNDVSAGKSIPSPYNFVPLSTQIVTPDWAPLVSHDIPFKDGLSGELSVELEAMSPIFVRNGGAWDENDRKNSSSEMNDFFAARIGDDVREKYLIPGSSIKGALRNVLEIVSFGKMSRISDRRYSLRDLYNGSYTSQLTNRNGRKITPLSKSGWLTEKDGEWHLVPCSYARVEQTEIRKYIEISLP